MSKWVDVPVTIFKTYAVEIEDGETIDDAINYAIEDCLGNGDVNVDRSNVTIAADDRQAEQIRILADERLAL